MAGRFTDILTVESSIMALLVLNARIVIMSIYWHFLVKGGTSVHLVIKSEWWNLGNICVKKCSRPFPTVISSLAYQRSSGDISSMIAAFSLILVDAVGNH